MRNILWLMLAAGGAYVAYVVYQNRTQQKQVRYSAKQVLPNGSRMSGRVAKTTTGRPPGFGAESSAFIPKLWAEVILPSSQKSWVEVQEA